MTVSATTTRNDYIAAAGQTVFAYTFKALDSTDLVVTKNGVVQSAYSVSGIGVATGGNVTFTSGVTANDAIAIYLAMPVTRDTNYQEGGAFLAGEVNADFDKIYIGAIQNENAIDRSMRLPESEPSVAMTLPIKDDRKGRYLQFNAITGAPEAGQSVIGDYSAGTGLDLTNYVFSIDSTVATLTGTQTLSGKTLTSPILNENLSGSAFLDEDNMASNSSTKVASQQSIKAYVDSQVGATDTLSEVLTNGNTTNGNDVKFGDNDKATFGASDGLEIFSDGTDSFIKETDTGSLQIWAKDFEVYNAGGTETLINADANAGVQLYFNNAQKLATTSTGIDVTGTATMDGLTVDGDTILLDSAASAFMKVDRGNNTSFGITRYYTAGTEDWRLGTLNDGTSDFYLQDSGSAERFKVGTNGDISFYEDTGTTAKIVWDASEETLFVDQKIKVGNTADGVVLQTSTGLASIIGTDTGGNGWNALDIRAGSATQLYLNTSGNVGIGTSSPAFPLDISGDRARIAGGTTTTFAGLEVENSNGFGTIFGTGGSERTDLLDNRGFISAQSATSGLALGTEGADPVVFYTGGTTLERLRIDSAGRVGIGTSSPIAALTVNGQIRASGSLGYTFNSPGDTDGGMFSPLDGVILFKSNNTERMRIDSAGNVGVGTSSPERKVHIFNGESGALASNASSAMVIEDDSNSYISFLSPTFLEAGLLFGDSGDNDSGALTYNHLLDRMSVKAGGVSGVLNIESTGIDVTGNVGIGIDSPSHPLTIQGSGTSGNAVKIVGDSTNNTGRILWRNSADSSETGRISVDGSSNLTIHTGSGGTERMRIDSAGRVGIGTSSPDHILCLEDAEPTLRIFDAANTLNQEQTIAFGTEPGNRTHAEIAGINTNTGNAAGALSFKTNAGSSVTERMRIDASGNLLVGKTAVTLNTEGHALTPTYARFTRNGAEAVQLNRLTSDGNILGLYKDGTAVGSIGAYFGDLFIASPSSTDAGLGFGGSKISPVTTTGATRDNAIDLGGSAARFKDLYLSGGVHLGGTGAANKLDDYEEGTWTPVDDSVAGLTFITSTGKYTKIGNKVYVSCHVTYPATAEGSNVRIGGLPFGVGSSQGDRAGLSVSYTTYTTPITALGDNNATYFELFTFGGSRRTNADFSAKVIYVGGFYEIA